MQYDATKPSSARPQAGHPACEVNASLLTAVSAVLVGTGLTVGAFLSSTPAAEIRPVSEAACVAIEPSLAPEPAPVRIIEPQAAPAASGVVELPCVGPACAGSAKPSLTSIQPS